MPSLRRAGSRSSRLTRVLDAAAAMLRGLPPITEEPITREMVRTCVGTESPTILEIGANNGGHTLWLLEMFENPQVYCFEPDPRAITRFKQKVGERANVHLFEMALSDRTGTITFHQSGGQHGDGQTTQMPEGWDLSGSIRAPKEHLDVHPWVTFENNIEVATTTLDAWSEAHGVDHVDFIWMDVQGAEIDVFRGGPDTLAATDYVYTEYSDQELYEGQLPLQELIDQLGHFRVLTRFPTDVLLENTKLRRRPSRRQKRA